MFWTCFPDVKMSIWALMETLTSTFEYGSDMNMGMS